jgi:hypothetical protein
MKKTIFLTLYLLILIIKNSYSQDEIPTNWSYIDMGNKIFDVQFLNAMTGFVAKSNGTEIDIMKTTNRGANWSSMVSSSTMSFNSGDIKPAGMYFFNVNLGFISTGSKIYKYNNGTVSSVLTYTDFNGSEKANKNNKIIFANSSTGYAIMTFDNSAYNTGVYRGRVYRTTNGGDNWSVVCNIGENAGNAYIYNLNDIAVSSSDNNKVIVCGHYRCTTNDVQKVMLIYSSDAFATNSGAITYSDGAYSFVNIKSDNTVILLKRGKRTTSTQYSYIYSIIWGDWENPTSLYQFRSPSNGAYNHTAMNFYNDNIGKILVDVKDGSTSTKRLLKTTNGGVNWSIDFDNVSSVYSDDYFGSISNIFSNSLELLYFIEPYNNSHYLFFRKIENTSVFATSESGYESSSNILIDGTSYSSPTTSNIIKPFFSLSYPSYIGDNKVFYKLSDNNLKNAENTYILPDNSTVEAYYKTKQVSTVSTALSNPSSSINSPQIRILKDTNGYIHQIHESMGGIFYTRSTDGGANWFREEVVNGEYEYANSSKANSSDNNSYPSICELRKLSGNLPAFPPSYSYMNTAATWQRYNNGTMEIKVAFRELDASSNPFWRRYGTSTTVSENSGIFRSFSVSQSDYKSKPSIFAAWYNFDSGYPNFNDSTLLYHYLILIPHLEPATSGNKLVVTAKLRGYPGYDDILGQNASGNNFTIESSGVTDFSVTSKPYITGDCFDGFILYFTYIKNGDVMYRADKFTIITGSMEPGIGRSFYHSLETISTSDEQIERVSPDISLRNGYPIIAYRGKFFRQQHAIIEPGGMDLIISAYDYPIIVKYKYLTTSNTESWSSFTPFQSGGHIQGNPNIEGDKNYGAYIVNFSFDGNTYRQYAYTNVPASCSSSPFSGTDAKLVRGAFSGSTFPNSSPMLLTLSQSGSLYNIGKLNITVSNSVPITPGITDNVVGIIREQSVNYNFELGPVIAKNTNVTFNDDAETSVTNNIEFGSTMVSAPFSLGPNDTLILNGTGYYNYVSGATFTEKRFTVNLMRKSNNELFSQLVSDTIHAEDTISSQYLRGFVFSSDILSNVDSFYVQMVIDSTSLYQSDDGYAVCNVYSPDEIYAGEGDNTGTYKRYVHFADGNNNKTNASITPNVYALSQNYPNPFNPTTNIKYQIPKDGFVTLKIYDITGREIAKLVNEQKQAGYYTVSFNGSNFASGVYFYRIQAGDFMQVKRMVLIK